jgi:hypothetical protein
MNVTYVPIFTDGLREYYKDSELFELFELFDVDVPLDLDTNRPAHMSISRNLLTLPEHGNNWRLLEALVPSLVSRARERTAHTSYERQDHHRDMAKRLESLEAALGSPSLPTELSTPEYHHFTAKSQVREFIGKADTTIIIVDNYIGAGTLDCLRDAQQPIRLLTGEWDRCIENEFSPTLQDFRAEGFTIEVRRHKKLHDRYIIFSERLWLVGSSLKDAGKKSFNAIECIDSKSQIMAVVDAKWEEASQYNP